MALRVIGAGVGRTGTSSLKLALEELLGGRCHHMAEVEENPDQISVWTTAARGEMPSWQGFLKDYVALVDWPGAAFWPELSEAFPDALVLLSVRDAESWYESARATILKESGDSDEWTELWSAIQHHRFCDEPHDRAKAMAAMEAHNSAVRTSTPSERLLIWQVTDGWEPLCRALDRPVPDKPFPHTNTREQFQKEWVGQKSFPGSR